MTTIRKATPSDILLIREMAWKTFPATYSEILSREQTDYMMEWMYSITNLHKQMEEEGHVYFIAYKEGKPCDYIACEDNEPAGYVSVQRQGPGLFHLQKIYVLPAFQKCRLGRKLFEHAVSVVRELACGPCTMELNVNRDNPALGFYEHMGMKKVRQGDFPIGNGYYMNDYIMALRIE